MRDRTLQNLIKSIAWFLWALTLTFAVRQAWNHDLPASDTFLILLGFALTATICLRLSRRGVTSFAAASLITLLVAEPVPWSLALGLIVIAAGSLWHSPRERRRLIQSVSSRSVAWTLAYSFLVSGILPPVEPPMLWLAVQVGLAWSIFRGVSWALVQVLEPGARAATPAPRPAELLNPVFASLFVILVSNAGAVALLAAPLTIGAQALSARLHNTRRELRRTRMALESRTAELLMLHAVGQELISRPDDRRLGPLLDRECRKLFEPEGFTLWLADDETLRQVYRREGERIDSNPAAADPDLSRWLREEKRGLCWRKDEYTLDLKPRTPFTQSALLAPLLVDERVAGALVVESRHSNRYNEHQLSVLTTLAQQAASALESAQQQKRASIDSLTGFFLREYFFRRLDEEQRRARRYGGRFALLMIDLDGFKAINDRNGHLAGDRYLCAVAATIRAQLRGADMPCRYGGDEFSLLLPETDLPGACAIAERIREAVGELRIDAEGASLRSTVSIGLAAFPEHSTPEVKGLLRRADEALYRAKRAGRDRVVPYAA